MVEKKFCPECQKLGLKSKLRSGMASTIFEVGDSYWDEDGVYREFPPKNYTSVHYHCSNDHDFEETYMVDDINGK